MAKVIFSQYLISVWVKTVEPKFKACSRSVETFCKALFWVTLYKTWGNGIIYWVILIWLQYLDNVCICKNVCYVSLNILKLRRPLPSSMDFSRIVSCFSTRFHNFSFHILLWYSYSTERVVIPSVEQALAIFKPRYVTKTFWQVWKCCRMSFTGKSK